MNKAIICGYYGQGNAGDEALLISILNCLPTKIKPIVLSANPQLTKENYGVESYSRLQIIGQILRLGKNDLFIWGGGSLIQDVTSIRSPLFYLGLMKLAQVKGLKTIAYAQGIGPIQSKIIKGLTRQVLSNCDGISVRDEASAQLLDDWGLDYLLAPDPVWALPSKDCEDLDLLPSPRIAVNLRSHPLLSEAKIRILIEGLINLQKLTQTHILLIPFQPEKDLALAERLKNSLGNTAQIINLTNPQQIKGIFKQVRMLIGMRLHSLIMAAGEKCNCFALSYDPKVDNLIKSINIAGYSLENLPNNKNVVCEIWLKIYQKDSILSDSEITQLAEQAKQHQNLLNIINDN